MSSVVGHARRRPHCGAVHLDQQVLEVAAAVDGVVTNVDVVVRHQGPLLEQLRGDVGDVVELEDQRGGHSAGWVGRNGSQAPDVVVG